MAQALHGHQVAYGLLVQLELENRDAAFMEDMRSFFRAAKLPLKLADLGVDQTSNSTVATIADLSAAAAHMKKFDREITSDDIAQAISRIEAA